MSLMDRIGEMRLVDHNKTEKQVRMERNKLYAEMLLSFILVGLCYIYRYFPNVLGIDQNDIDDLTNLGFSGVVAWFLLLMLYLGIGHPSNPMETRKKLTGKKVKDIKDWKMLIIMILIFVAMNCAMIFGSVLFGWMWVVSVGILTIPFALYPSLYIREEVNQLVREHES